MTPDGVPNATSKRLARTILRAIGGCLAAAVLGLVGVAGSCHWDDSHTLGRADRLFRAARAGMTSEEVLALAGGRADEVRVDEEQKGWRAKRLVADFRGVHSRYCVQFCLAESGRVTEVVPPAQYAEGCFLVDEDGAPRH